MAPRASVQALHPVSEEQALAWLRSQGRVTISASELGRRWSWHRQRVGRRLHAWTETGRIDRRGKTITWKNVATPVQKPVTNVDATGGHVTPPSRADRRTSFFRILLIMLLLFLGVVITLIMMFTNVTSWMSLAKTSEAQYPIGALGLAIDALAVTLPAASRFAPFRTRVSFTAMWAVAVFLVAWTNVGFASGNFGEMAESRRATIERRDILDDRLKSLRVNLAYVGERRHQCESGGPCALAKNRQTRIVEVDRLTVLADGIKSDLERYEGELKNLPAIVLADPQIAGGVKAVKRLAGYSIDLADASIGRDIVFALMLVLLPSGLIRGAISLVRD